MKLVLKAEWTTWVFNVWEIHEITENRLVFIGNPIKGRLRKHYHSNRWTVEGEMVWILYNEDELFEEN